jgi:uncharacterized protein DUF4058
MKSPFPGMDPYLEEPSLWPDVHLTLIIAMRAVLNASMPPGYAASADRYVWIHEPEAGERTRVIRLDVDIVKEQESGPAATTTMISAPRTVILPVVRHEGNKYLKIVDSRSKHLVTVIELLSPANKRPGLDREAYLTKRIDYLAAGVNVVEIDLLRGGQRLPIEGSLPPNCDYYALVCRARQMPTAGIWPFGVRDPLPTIPIPLLPADGDVPLDLRVCLDRAFEESRYDLKLNYQQPPEPPLSSADAQWARGLLEKSAAS